MKARAKRLTAPDASTLIDRLATLYTWPKWTLVREVSSSVGRDPDAPEVLRRADAIAACNFGGGSVAYHAFEVKRSAADLAVELAQPEKSGPFVLFCAEFSLVVPAPWKNVIPSLSVLPHTWGVIECGLGDPLVVRPAVERLDVEPPTNGFLRALLRAAGDNRRQGRGEPEDTAPRKPIVAPLSRIHVALGCGHRAPFMGKRLGGSVPCLACAAGLAPDREVVEGMIDDASAEVLEAWRDQIASRLRVTGPASVQADVLPPPQMIRRVG